MTAPHETRQALIERLIAFAAEQDEGARFGTTRDDLVYFDDRSELLRSAASALAAGAEAQQELRTRAEHAEADAERLREALTAISRLDFHAARRRGRMCSWTTSRRFW